MEAIHSLPARESEVFINGNTSENDDRSLSDGFLLTGHLESVTETIESNPFVFGASSVAETVKETSHFASESEASIASLPLQRLVSSIPPLSREVSAPAPPVASFVINNSTSIQLLGSAPVN